MVKMLMLVFWVETPCILIGRYQHFVGMALQPRRPTLVPRGWVVSHLLTLYQLQSCTDIFAEWKTWGRSSFGTDSVTGYLLHEELPLQ
jgi:hypothetical protein